MTQQATASAGGSACAWSGHYLLCRATPSFAPSARTSMEMFIAEQQIVAAAVGLQVPNWVP